MQVTCKFESLNASTNKPADTCRVVSLTQGRRGFLKPLLFLTSTFVIRIFCNMSLDLIDCFMHLDVLGFFNSIEEFYHFLV